MALEVGLSYQVEKIVEEPITARGMGSGTLDVLATPIVVAGLEEASWRAVAPYLDEDCCTVGTKVEISHEAPTPLGMKATFRGTLVEIDGRRLVFEVEAWDEVGRIAGGRHERFIVQNERFQQKADAKLEAASATAASC